MPSLRFALAQGLIAISVVVACLVAGTQWATAMRGYQAAGCPLIDLVGLKIYAPWKLFAWWLVFEAQAPEVFARAGAIATFGGFASGLVAIEGVAWRAGHKNQIITYGSTRWVTSSDVRDAGLLANKGCYLRHEDPEHVLAVAPMRARIGVGLVAPTLNRELTAGWRATCSRTLLFDPTNPRSACFNPLLEVRRGIEEVRDVQNIADILVDPEGARDRRDHWEKTAHSLLTGAILHVLYAEEEKTLARVATFLANPARSILRTLWIMLTPNHLGTDQAPKAHPVVASIARELLNKSDNERSGVVSTVMSLLGLYRDPVIAANTATCDWRIGELMGAERPVSLYLVVPPSDIARTRPLVRLILNQIARRLTETLPSHGAMSSGRLLLMLDEFPALGRLDFFELSLAFLAGYGVRAFLVAQSLHQIDKAYGHNHAILDNCHVHVAFAPNDERTVKRLSDALGTATELRAQRNLSGKRVSAWLSHTSISQQETPRLLPTAGEILQLSAADALVFVSSLPPIRARELKYFDDRNFLVRRLRSPVVTDTAARQSLKINGLFVAVWRPVGESNPCFQRERLAS